MKHFLKLLIIFFYCFTNIQAQGKLKEGYIISLTGDTIKGFLFNNKSKKACKECIFKSASDNTTKSYKPNEIAGYRYINGKYYISKEIQIDSSSKKLVFLEFLINGMANIYYYVDNDEEHYYIEKNPQGLLELTEKERIFSNESGVYVMPKQYKNKLNLFLQDCPGINNEIQNTQLTHKSLINLTKNYHEKVCSSERCIIYERDNTSAIVKLGVLIGFSKNQYNFGNQLISNYGNNYQIGAGLKISNFLMFNDHVNIKTNILFEKDSRAYTLTKSNDLLQYFVTLNNERYYLGFDPYKNITQESIKTNLNVMDLKIPITLNYDFNLSKNTIFSCGIGISNKIILSQNMDLKIDEFYKRYNKNINSFLSGVIVTTGIEGKWLGKHSIFVNVGYEHLIDLRSGADQTLRLRNNQLSVLMGIYF